MIRIWQLIPYPASISGSIPPTAIFIPHNIIAGIEEIPVEVMCPVASMPVPIPPPRIPPYIMHTIIPVRVIYPVPIAPVIIIPVFIFPVFTPIVIIIIIVNEIRRESENRYCDKGQQYQAFHFILLFINDLLIPDNIDKESVS